MFVYRGSLLLILKALGDVGECCVKDLRLSTLQLPLSFGEYYAARWWLPKKEVC
jgi:hypothetical protein